jgi:thioredoxin 1
MCSCGGQPEQTGAIDKNIKTSSETEAKNVEKKSSIIKNISVGDFEALVGSQPFVVVDFHAVWCRPCKIMAPHLETIQKEYSETELKIVKIDVDENVELAMHLNVVSYPTVKIYKNGKEVKSVVGGMDEAKLRALFAKFM